MEPVTQVLVFGGIIFFTLYIIGIFICEKIGFHEPDVSSVMAGVGIFMMIILIAVAVNVERESMKQEKQEIIQNYNFSNRQLSKIDSLVDEHCSKIGYPENSLLKLVRKYHKQGSPELFHKEKVEKFCKKCEFPCTGEVDAFEEYIIWYHLRRE